MPQKRNQDLTEKYPDIKAGTYELMRIKDILIKNRFSAVRQRSRIWVRHMMKEMKMLMVVDTLLLPLINLHN